MTMSTLSVEEAMPKSLMGVLIGLYALALPAGVIAATSKAEYQAVIARAEAEYSVALGKCDALAGAAKDACRAEAKARFGKS